MYFSDNPVDRYYEKIMIGIPNFQPRGYGTFVFGQKEVSPLFCERIQSGAASYQEIIIETTKSIKYRPFVIRLKQYLDEREVSPMNYRDNRHYTAFMNTIRKRDKSNFALMASLYLLTADPLLWHMVKHYTEGESINFEGIKLKCINTNGYILYCCAKDLYLGTKHISVSDLADTELISKRLFSLICNAMAIRRFGVWTEFFNDEYK